MSARLDKSDWIKAGLSTLAAAGSDAVRVERLANDLGVTKGSFYWHFKDRQALLEVMLQHWKTVATQAVINEVEARGGDSKVRLRTLFEIVMQSDGRLELAIRAWAAIDKAVAKAVKSIDRKRIGYTEQLFQELGFSPPEATARARFAYHALIGQYALGGGKAPAPKSREFDAVFAMLTRKPR